MRLIYVKRKCVCSVNKKKKINRCFYEDGYLKLVKCLGIGCVIIIFIFFLVCVCMYVCLLLIYCRNIKYGKGIMVSVSIFFYIVFSKLYKIVD